MLIKEIVDKNKPNDEEYEETYKKIHANPEFGFLETETAALVESKLNSIGFDVKTQIGKTGVVGLLCNGQGPTVLLRADMDALPVLEQTNLPYASKAQATDVDGRKKAVMHACGHDVHVTCLLGATELLHSARSQWQGTLICLFQPDEERGAGAKAMVDDGLYDRVPKPDVVLGQHVFPQKSGTVVLRAGSFMSARDTFKVTVFGRGGHGSQPEHCVDPIVIGGYIVTRLQSIVSREIAPHDVAAVTCASIHAGETDNVIPDRLELQVDVRSFDDKVRDRIVAAIKRIVEAECAAAGVKQSPLIEQTRQFPPTVNDEVTIDTLRGAFETQFGSENTVEGKPVAASEDVSILATAIDRPYAYWFIGGADPKQYDEAPQDVPRNHSPFFAPVIQPTLRTGIKTLAVAALTFLNMK